MYGEADDHRRDRKIEPAHQEAEHAEARQHRQDDIPEEVKSTPAKIEETPVVVPAVVTPEVIVPTTVSINNNSDSVKTVATIAEVPKKDSLPTAE